MKYGELKKIVRYVKSHSCYSSVYKDFRASIRKEHPSWKDCHVDNEAKRKMIHFVMRTCGLS